MKQGENKLLDHLIDKGEEVRKLADGCANKNWHFGYKSGLKFVAETYTALRFPPRSNVEKIICEERVKIRKELLEMKDKELRLRLKGCLQAFDDLIDEIKKGELIA